MTTGARPSWPCSCFAPATRRPGRKLSDSPVSASLTTSARAPSRSSTRCRVIPAERSSSGHCAPRTGPDATGRSDRRDNRQPRGAARSLGPWAAGHERLTAGDIKDDPGSELTLERDPGGTVQGRRWAGALTATAAGPGADHDGGARLGDVTAPGGVAGAREQLQGERPPVRRDCGQLGDAGGTLACGRQREGAGQGDQAPGHDGGFGDRPVKLRDREPPGGNDRRTPARVNSDGPGPGRRHRELAARRHGAGPVDGQLPEGRLRAQQGHRPCRSVGPADAAGQGLPRQGARQAEPPGAERILLLLVGEPGIARDRGQLAGTEQDQPTAPGAFGGETSHCATTCRARAVNAGETADSVALGRVLLAGCCDPQAASPRARASTSPPRTTPTLTVTPAIR